MSGNGLVTDYYRGFGFQVHRLIISHGLELHIRKGYGGDGKKLAPRTEDAQNYRNFAKVEPHLSTFL
jgi:hypothetical protein